MHYVLQEEGSRSAISCIGKPEFADGMSHLCGEEMWGTCSPRKLGVRDRGCAFKYCGLS